MIKVIDKSTLSDFEYRMRERSKITLKNKIGLIGLACVVIAIIMQGKTYRWDDMNSDFAKRISPRWAEAKALKEKYQDLLEKYSYYSPEIAEKYVKLYQEHQNKAEQEWEKVHKAYNKIQTFLALLLIFGLIAMCVVWPWFRTAALVAFVIFGSVALAAAESANKNEENKN